LTKNMIDAIGKNYKSLIIVSTQIFSLSLGVFNMITKGWLKLLICTTVMVLLLNPIMLCAGGYTQKYEGIEAKGDILGISNIQSVDGRNYGCLLMSGEFFILIPDKRNFHQIKVAIFSKQIQFVIKKYLGMQKEPSGKIFLAEGTYGHIMDIKGDKPKIIGTTDGENIYFINDAIAPANAKVGYRYLKSPNK